jgi:hypothetical protein
MLIIVSCQLRTNHSRRYTRHSFARSNVSRNYCPAAYNRAIFDDNTFQDDCSRADPDIAADSDCARYKRLLGHRGVSPSSVVMVCDVAERANKALPTDVNTLRCVEHGEAIDIGTAADHQSWCTPSAAGSQQYHVIIQRRSVFNHDIPRIPWDTNPSNPTIFANADAEQPQAKNPQPHGDRTRIADEPVD